MSGSKGAEDSGERSRGMRAALRHRDFRLVLVAQTISWTGDWLYGVSLIVYVLSVTSSAGWVAATSFVRFLPYVLLGTFGGMIADRYDRKRVMIGADLGRACIQTALAIVAALRAPAFVAIALAAMSATFSTAFMPAMRASVPSLVPEDDLASANALVSTVDNLTLALGPAIGGILLLTGSPSLAFAVNALTFLASAALMSGVRTKLSTAAEAAPAPFRQRLTEGLRAVASSSAVLVLVTLGVGLTIFYGQEIVLYALLATDRLAMGDQGLAFLWASIGVGGVLAAGFTSRVASRRRLASIVAVAGLVAACPMMVLSFVRAPALVFSLVAIEGAAVIVCDVVSITLLQRSVAPNVLGRVFGILDSLMVGGILIGSLIAPIVVATKGLGVAMVAAGGLLAVITVVTLPRARKLDELTASRADELQEKIERLGAFAMFEDVPRPTIEALAALAAEQRVLAGALVVREGDAPDALYLILQGRFSVRSSGERGVERSISELGPDDVFGEIGILERIPRTASVEALSDGLLYRIEAGDFLQGVAGSPRISGRLLGIATARLAVTHPGHAVGST